jgi:hypothetical protein
MPNKTMILLEAEKNWKQHCVVRVKSGTASYLYATEASQYSIGNIA